MKRKLIIILSVILAIVVLLFCGMSYFIGIQVFKGSMQLVTNETTSDVPKNFWEEYNMDYNEFCEKYKIERIEITSTLDGHIIPGDYIYANQSEGNKNNKTVVLVHGLGGNRYTTYPYAEMFLEKGFNVLTYDQRSTNENTAKYTTFGYLEKYDLIDCIDYIKENAPGQIIGVWGTSFGGATAGLAMGYKDTDKKVDFLILDCPISSMEWMINTELKDMNIGISVSYMSWCGNIVTKLRLGFSYKDADVSKAMRNVEIPVLIINSKADTVTPYFMGKDIYDSIKGTNKQIWTVEDSEHVMMWIEHNQEYREKVTQLLDSIEN
ncbi:MAG TPA: alpha/beta hydrolase [Mobilitalea sp.]|nr:alpha/beta hydrolase [Mobilitalea sp.]